MNKVGQNPWVKSIFYPKKHFLPTRQFLHFFVTPYRNTYGVTSIFEVKMPFTEWSIKEVKMLFGYKIEKIDFIPKFCRSLIPNS